MLDAETEYPGKKHSFNHFREWTPTDHRRMERRAARLASQWAGMQLRSKSFVTQADLMTEYWDAVRGAYTHNPETDVRIREITHYYAKIWMFN